MNPACPGDLSPMCDSRFLKRSPWAPVPLQRGVVSNCVKSIGTGGVGRRPRRRPRTRRALLSPRRGARARAPRPPRMRVGGGRHARRVPRRGLRRALRRAGAAPPCSGREHSFGAPTHPVFLHTTLSKEIRLEHRAAAGRRRRGGDGGDKGTLSRRLRTIGIILVKPPGTGGIRSHLLTPRRPLAPAPNARAAGWLSRTAPRQPPHVRAGAGVRTQWRWALGKPKGLGRGRKMTCRHGGRAWSRGVYAILKLLFIPS